SRLPGPPSATLFPYTTLFRSRPLRFDGEPDPAREVPAVGVVPHLASVAEDVQRVLAFQHLLDEVGDHVAHSELDVATVYVAVPQRSALADAHTVERTQDREGQRVLLVRPTREVLGGELLEAIGRPGWWAGHLSALRSGEHRRRFEDHAARENGDLL